MIEEEELSDDEVSPFVYLLLEVHQVLFIGAGIGVATGVAGHHHGEVIGVLFLDQLDEVCGILEPLFLLCGS